MAFSDEFSKSSKMISLRVGKGLKMEKEIKKLSEKEIMKLQHLLVDWEGGKV